MVTTTVRKMERLTLTASTAADLMMPNPVSIGDNASIHEAIALLVDNGFSAAPVIDHAGRPVGVVSRSDVLTYDREKVECTVSIPDYYAEAELDHHPEHLSTRKGFHVVNVDRTPVRDIMTPVVFSVRPETAAHRVVEDMLALKVHRLFVVDEAGVLVGVVSATDILRNLAL
jgi:CBS domain-containing protein